MKNFVHSHINPIAWGIFVIANGLAVAGWLAIASELTTIYRFFPLLGLLAFCTMWGHYAVWALREWSGAFEVRLYSEVTHYFVLVSLLLHPGLFIYQLNKDGLGLPPASYEAYLGKALVPFVFLGMVSLFAFLAFEFKKWLVSKKIWKYILIANHIAMFGIIIHGFKLGTVIDETYFKFVWVAFALIYTAILIYLGSKRKLA